MSSIFVYLYHFQAGELSERTLYMTICPSLDSCRPQLGDPYTLNETLPKGKHTKKYDC